MQSNTGSETSQVTPLVPPAGLEKWEDLLHYLPDGVNLASAREAGALIRRRKITSAGNLLRLVLAYAVCDCSLSLLAMQAAFWGLGQLSKVALRQRLQHCAHWLGLIIMALLRRRHWQLLERPGVWVRLQDATVLTIPGSKGTDWRLHLVLDLGAACLAGIELTDAHGAETLARFPAQAGEIRVADGGYPHAKGMGALLQAGGQLVVRTNWQNLPLEEEEGGRFDVIAWLHALERTGAAGERTVWLQTPQGRFALRLLACPLPPEKAEEARRRARKNAKKKKHTVDARTLCAAGFVLLVTNLPAAHWPLQDVLTLYRMRWQIELLIKRLKSLLQLDGLRARDPALVQTYLLGKLLGALLLEEMSGQITRCIPAVWDAGARPLSPWRLMDLCQRTLKSLIRGNITLAKIVTAMSALTVFLCDTPRKRKSQWATARAWINALSSC